ncbi:MAG: TonB-dependent receptor [Bacteroidales bacterium]|nr:TonB-dependent receptor [Bacteroidales bacterium]
MKRFLLTTALLLLLPLIVLSQFIFSGSVSDAENGKPLPGANVLIQGTFRGIFTDASGEFRIENIKAGTYNVTVSYLGYENIQQLIVLDQNKQLDIFLTRSTFLTEEFVVSATRADNHTPATFTNLTREELSASNLGQDLPFLISLTPSLVTSSDAGAGVGYTWMNIRGSDNTRINVTVNGVPINDAESHGVWWVNMPDIVSSVDNMQIQRGVGLSTHGAGAFGGTISLQTTSLSDKPYAEISSSAGSYNTMKNSLSLGSGLIGKHWAFDGRISMTESDGYIDRASSRLRSYYFSGGFYGEKTVVKAITFSGNEKTYQAWYGVPGDSLKSNRTFNPAGLYYDDQGTIRYYDNETDNYQQDHYQLHLTHAFSDAVTANITGHYTYGRGFYEQYRANDEFSRYNLPDVEIGTEVITSSDLVRQRWLDNHFYGFTYSFNYIDMNRWNMTWGGGYNIYEGDHFGEIIWARFATHANIRHRYYQNDGLKKDFNTFLKADYEILPGLHIFTDLQYRNVAYNFLGLAWVQENITDLQQDASFHFFNPKLGINYNLNSFASLYAYAGIGNREPVRDDFTDSSPESRPKEETLRNIEIGFNQRGKNFMFNSNLYLMDYKNQLILTGEINDVGGFTRKNIDKSYRTGIEIEAALIITPNLQWQGNLTLSRNIIPRITEYVDQYDNGWNWIGFESKEYRDVDIAFSPSIIAASIFSYKPVDGLNLNLSSKYVGKQFIDNTSSRDRMLKAYLTHNLRMNYSIYSAFLKEIQLTVQINNLTNSMYSTNAWVYKGVFGDQGLITIEDGYFPQAGVHFLVGINLKF